MYSVCCFPATTFRQPPSIGTGALLLLANVVGLLLQRKGRPEALSRLSLAVTMLGLATITLYAVLDTLAIMGIGPTDTDGYWTVLMIALLLTILGLSLYAITASIGGVFPSWVALPLAFSGVLLLLSVPVVAMGVPEHTACCTRLHEHAFTDPDDGLLRPVGPYVGRGPA